MSPSRSRNQTELDERDFGPSRTQKRRDALEVLALAGQLVQLPASKLDRLDLPDDVRDEIANVRRITAHVARKRQLAYLAKLMRRHDAEVFDKARAELGADHERQQQQTAALHRLEDLRERLLGEDGDEVLGQLLGEHPDLDHQHLRNLVRQARAERASAGKSPSAFHKLFRLLREIPPRTQDSEKAAE